MSIPFVSLLLQGIPEMTAIAFLAFAIAGIPLKWKKALMCGIILGFCMYVVRLLPVPFGTHSVVMVFLLFLILVKSNNKNVGLCFNASLLSYLTIVIYEFICFSLFMRISGLSLKIIYSNLALKIVVAEPQVIFLLFSAFLINTLKNNRSLHKCLFLNISKRLYKKLKF